MLKRWLILMLVVALGSPQRGMGADTVDTDLATGVRQAQEGDFESAVVTLDGVVRRLTGQPARAKDLARAYTYLSIAYLGLSQEQTAKAKFLEAWKADREMSLSAREFPPRILEFFERAREEAKLASPAPAAAPAPAPAPPAAGTSAPEPKKKGSKTVPILIGAAVLGGVGVAVAAGGGGGGGVTPTPTPQGGPLAIRLTWTTGDDLDLHVIEPSGFELFFLSRNSPTGGTLSEDVVCTPGTETASWGGNAPRGNYVFWANNSPSCGPARAVSFTLTVSQGNSVVLTRTGTIAAGGESQRFSFVN